MGRSNVTLRKTMIKKICCLLALLPLASQAQVSPGQIDLLASEAQSQVVEWRRWFHQNPELSNREFNTAEKVAGVLREMGLEPVTGIAHTGVVAIIEGGKPGPLVAIRSDMDALPVTEQTGLPFASQATDQYNGVQTGVMHACGHDSHMAMLLGAAWVLNSVKDQLAGSVMLIFQPAEEGPPEGEEGGAMLMLKEGIWDERKPDAVFGIHVGFNLPGGQVAVRPGPLMAAADSFKMVVKGRQTHGAMPWNGVDPIVLSAQIVMAFQTIESRQVDVTLAPSIISVGRISGGIRGNVIPDEVVMEGTIRTFDKAMRLDIHERMERMARAIAEASGAEIEFELGLGTPAVINDPELFARMLPTLQRVSGDNPVHVVTPQTVAEDFSIYAEQTPGLFLFLGNGPPDVDPATLATNHSPFFDMHEPNLEVGVRIFSNLVIDYLNGQ
jgi:amidohydrolase